MGAWRRPGELEMSMDADVRAGILAKFQHHEKDTGSAEVQIALLTQRIEDLNGHLKIHKKDKHSRRGLLQMVGRRRKFLSYLQKKSFSKYQEVIKELGLRK